VLVRLSSGDTHKLLTFVADAAPLQSTLPFTTALIDQLTVTIESEFATYYTFDPTDGASHDEYVPCSREAPMPEEGWGGVPAVVDLHRHDVQLWSDTLPRAGRWRYESAPFARAAEVVDCAWTVIPVTPRKSAMLNFHRQGRDFTERDRRFVEALRPHVVALIRAADARRRLADLMSAVDAVDEDHPHGFVLLGTGNEIEHASPSARVLLQRWLDAENGRLPGIVDEWLRSASRPTPLRLQQGNRRLVVEAPTPSALVLREEPVPPGSLTPRELEILGLVADGKSTAQIASQLWVTPATVSKHLEHCYRKLGVASRTAAIAAAGLTTPARQ